MNTYYLAGSIILVLGLLLVRFVSRRRFNRRGPGGLQHYNSYDDSIVIRVFEWIVKMIAYIMIICSLALLVHGYRLGHPEYYIFKTALSY